MTNRQTREGKPRVLVLGDVLVDRYHYCTQRTNPEGTFIAATHNGSSVYPGGSLNVAFNLHWLGFQVAAVGPTLDGPGLSDIHLAVTCRPEIEYNSWVSVSRPGAAVDRYFVGGYPYFRLGPGVQYLPPDAQRVCSRIAYGHVDYVVISDYCKGSIDESLAGQVLLHATAMGVPVFVDTKPEHLHWYATASFVQLNEAAADAIYNGSSVMNLLSETPQTPMTAKWLASRLAAGALVVTRGARSTLLTVRRDVSSIQYDTIEVPPVRVPVVDHSTPVGAGDSFLAGAVYGYNRSTCDRPYSLFMEATRCGNAAGAMASTQPGTYAVTELDLLSLLSPPVLSLELAAELSKAARSADFVVGLTNGCFDGLHIGHANLLSAAKSVCDVLFVAVDTDDAVRKLKGEGRPFVPFEHRVESARNVVKSSYSYLNRAFFLAKPSEMSVSQLVAALRPGVMIKGQEYRAVGDDLPGLDAMREYGGGMYYVPMTENISTTALARAGDFSGA